MRRRVSALALLALIGAACSSERETAPDAARTAERPLRVYAVNHPLQYFAQRIGASHVEVAFPAPPDVDPAEWVPTAEIVAAYQGADLILLNGAGYARWVAWASLPQHALVDTSTGFRERLLDLEGATTHGHGPQGAHSHEGLAFTVWLDPTLARAQAAAVAEALAQARPAHADAFGANLAALEADLLALDARLAQIAAALGDTPLLFSHPVYGYLEHRYGLNGRSLHWEPDSVPNPAAWRELERLLAEHPARWVVWEASPRRETAQRLEALGLRSIVYAPAGGRPEAGDWLAVMRENAAQLAALAEG